MARDRFAEILDLECSLQARGEEAAKGRNERGKGREHEYVQLHGRDHDRGITGEGELICSWKEDRIGSA